MSRRRSTAFWFLAGAVFGVFDVAVYVARRTGASSSALDAVALVISAVFLICVAVLGLLHLRSRGGPSGAAARFLRGSPEARAALGGTPRVRELHASRDGSRVEATLRGPDGEGRAEVDVAREGSGWVVRSATLATGDVRVPLARP